MSKPHHIVTIICSLLSIIFSAQLHAQDTLLIKYTTKDGLPSASVYRTVIDSKGFLWIATENGLARFDGRKFQAYTTAHGLTDNEIIDLFIDSSGVMWAIPFRRSPCYYNEKRDRFENSSTDAELNKVDLGNTHRVHVLQYGGVAFSNNQRKLFILKEGKTKEFSGVIAAKSGVVQKIIEYAPEQYVFFCEDTIRWFSNGKLTRNMPFNRRILVAEHLNNKVYIVWSDGIVAYNLNAKGELTFAAEKKLPFQIRIFCNTGKRFATTSINGNTYMIDTATLEIKENVLSRVQVRSVLEDKDGNTWISTMENGLIKIQRRRIFSYTAVPVLVQNFNALAKTDKIIAGTNNGEVYVYDGFYNARRIALTDDKEIDAWVRKIVATSKGIYVSTQTGSFLFDNDCTVLKEKYTGAANKASKTAVLLNDSILATGTHAQAWKYNLRTDQWVDSIAKRITSITADQNGRVYIGSNDGLYRWDGDTLYSFAKNNTRFPYRVNTMVCSPDNILWVGQGSDSLLVLKDDQLITSIALGGTIPGNICKSLFCNIPGEIWLGTNKGLNKIQYELKDGQLSYTNTYFGAADGLIGEQVNDIAFRNDTIYVATSGGISYMPAALKLAAAEIATYITGVTINNVPAELKDSYSLPYSENDVTIDFSGVDLTGFIPLFEYSINNRDWQRTEKIELKRLAPGSYTILVRAIKRDGSPAINPARVFISIKTPFWKNNIFWGILVLLSFATLIFFLQRRNKQRQKKELEKVLTEKRMAELEMQALKAQINPHFVFNCLNSIKGFIYDKDYMQADKYLDKFSELLRSTMDNADASIISLTEEIRYLDTYLQLEKLRFEDKFDYEIITEPGIQQDALFVPAMLLQPYVENAIRHGVRHLENRKGKITISNSKEGSFLVCYIDDNGIGRERAKQLRSKMHIEYQSRGMQLSKRRAELYNIQQEIIDKKNDKGEATGTTIILRIPPDFNQKT